MSITATIKCDALGCHREFDAQNPGDLNVHSELGAKGWIQMIMIRITAQSAGRKLKKN
ncbi:hypothetical protein Ga0061065_12144 [Marinomonas fungiae]|uniref:Uncharacterized protein n=1 Tax=Marinomonas fungiae TaxID=1137284 RepID=A0A0K6IUJ2_9GAMM|nr:hypothetical protein Ga0061065_12144 [Marinomonas fungiae]